MAAPAPSDKVKDKEYTNWLKVTLALYYMKSGLHTFIQSEIDCLHQSLLQRIYSRQTVPTACHMCNVSLARRNKHTGVWTFQNQCKLPCNVWFRELLALHNNPKSDKIYWANSDVSLWPFNPWECAKVFLPRGQQPTNTGPAESDAQALMVLLTNCKHFQGKLSPQGQQLTRTISDIRNRVIHHGEMKVSDTDRQRFMQTMIQLLEDPVHLKPLEECKTAANNIHKIDTDSVDVFFNVDREMTALRSLVNELRLALGNQDKEIIMDSVDSLKEECRQLREELTKRFEDFEKELELHGGRLGAVEENVELHGGRLGTVEENVELNGERLGTVEENVELHGGRLGTVEENVELHEKRLGTLEEKVEKLQKGEETVVKLNREIGQVTREGNSCMKDTKGHKRSLCGDANGHAPKRRGKKQGTKGQKRTFCGDQDGPAPKRTTKQQEKLHRSILNRCLPRMLMDLDVKTVSMYIQQKEVFDDVTMCDILHHGPPSDRIKGLIKRVQQRGQDTYEKFKECLVLAKQGDLKDMLEEEEANVGLDKDIGWSLAHMVLKLVEFML